MGSKKTPHSSPSSGNNIAETSGRDSANHFEVAGKRYKRKRPRVDDNAYQAIVSSYREDPTNKPKTREEKMALLEANCIWQGAEGGKGSDVNAAEVTRYLEISKALRTPSSTIYRIVREMVIAEFLESAAGSYLRLGPAFIKFNRIINFVS